jgi:hypothetical protein
MNRPWDTADAVILINHALPHLDRKILSNPVGAGKSLLFRQPFCGRLPEFPSCRRFSDLDGRRRRWVVAPDGAGAEKKERKEEEKDGTERIPNGRFGWLRTSSPAIKGILTLAHESREP